MSLTPRRPEDELAQLEQAGLRRVLRPHEGPSGTQIVRDGSAKVNFASNDYLGLANHPMLVEAIAEGARKFGAGSSASRLICGTLPPHRIFEEEIAAAKKAEAALLFSSGFAVASGALPALVGKEDVVILDKLSHACLIDGARLSGATIRVFPHNDIGRLSALLESTRRRSPEARILIVTESVFSMDGDVCPLAEIVALKNRYGALLFLDEAHGFGVLGASGMGLAEMLELQDEVDFQMGTLSKAAGLSGGYLVASRAFIDLIINRARSFIFSTAPLPSLAHAASASLKLIRGAEGLTRRERLEENRRFLSDLLCKSPDSPVTPILPILLGANEAALLAAAYLETSGYVVPAIRYPTVPRGSARLRVSLSAEHTKTALQKFADCLRDCPQLDARS